MPRSFKVDYSIWPLNNPGAVVRLILVLLLVSNLVAAYFVLRPPGGSPQELAEQLQDLRVQLRQRQMLVQRTRLLAGKIETGRSQGDNFTLKYFLPRRSAYSVILAELNEDAAKAKVHPKESSYGSEPIEGSDTVSMMRISANFEGEYSNILDFINQLDKSDRLLIIENFSANPVQGSKLLNVTVKLDAFVAEEPTSAL